MQKVYYDSRRKHKEFWQARRDAMIKRAEERKGGVAPTGGAGPTPLAVRPTSGLESSEPPHNILFVENLPPATSKAMITMLFEQFPGFKEVRMVESRPGIAFVEFSNEMESSVALNGLQGFKITQDNSMKVSYAKR